MLRYNETTKVYNANHRDEINALQRKWKRNNKDKVCLNVKKRNRRRKTELIKAYGGSCTCCGEHRYEFLTLEHIGGGGKEHRERLGSTFCVYRDVERQGYPKDKYTILCMNCNFAERFGNTCPHKKEVVTNEA